MVEFIIAAVGFILGAAVMAIASAGKIYSEKRDE